MKKFYEFRNEATGSELFIRGVIAEDSWFDDDVTPEMFRKELAKASGPLTVWINSPGGDVFAASQIYTALVTYPHAVTVKIEGMAASAASVIAMAGTQVLMARTAVMMIHNPATMAWGDHNDMKDAIKVLETVKDSIINAYEKKTGIDRETLSKYMDQTKWMDANEAIELKFADGVIEKAETDDEDPKNKLFNKGDFEKVFNKVNKNILTKMVAKFTPPDVEDKNNDSGESGDEGGQKMFANVEELRAACPDLVREIEDAARTEAVTAERTRLQGIEEIVASVGDEEMIRDAKYGNPITAQELAFKAMKKQAEQNKQHLNDIADDADESGAKDLHGVNTPEDKTEPEKLTAEQRREAGRKAAEKAKGGNK